MTAPFEFAQKRPLLRAKLNSKTKRDEEGACRRLIDYKNGAGLNVKRGEDSAANSSRDK